MKKIAVFHPSNELYGADRIMVLATKAMATYQPIIYLPKNGPLTGFIKKEIPNAVVVILEEMPIISRAIFTPKGIFNTTKKYLKFRRYFANEMQVHQFKKIYVNTLACSFILPALRSFSVPIITHVHEILEHPKVAAKITAKLAFKYSHTVISVSQAVQNNLHLLSKKRKAKSIVVHNGIPAVELKMAPVNNSLSFYLFGRIKPEKGQWYLMEALKIIPKIELEGITFNLVGGTLAGKEQLKLDLENKIDSYGLKKHVHLKGFTADISESLAQADVCLIPSLMKDPFPTTVLEAMSVGKAIIATDTGGAKEAIKHNESGFIIPPNSPIAFAQIIRKLIRNRALIQKMGANAQGTFNENFTIEHFNDRWLNAVAMH